MGACPSPSPFSNSSSSSSSSKRPTIVLTVLLSAGIVLLVVWGATSQPNQPAQQTFAAIIKSTTARPLQGSAPPTAASLATYRAGLLEHHLSSWKQPFKAEDWDKFGPVIRCPKDRPLQKYGEGDGSKLLCKTQGLSRADGSPCIIYSLGSRGDFQFEEAMLKSTSCNIHTFDCTFEGKSIHPERHTYHQWCFGNGAGRYRTWSNITQTLGHDYIDLLKMDIEGHEYPVLASFKPGDALPKEISMEIHVRIGNAPAPDTAAELAFVFLHLSNLGYAPYAQEVNEIAPNCCSEFTLMRLSNATPCAKAARP